MVKGLTSDEAWKIYNFINDYKNGGFGLIRLQQALDEYFDNYKPYTGQRVY